MKLLSKSIFEERPTEEVTVFKGKPNETKLVLEEPDCNALFRIRDMLSTSANRSSFLKSMAAAVQECLPEEELDLEQAIRLINRNGGETGKLAKTAWTLVGMVNSEIDEKRAKEDAADPLDSGSPGNSD